MVSSPERAKRPGSGKRREGSVSIGRIVAYIISALILGRTFLLDAAVVQGRSMLPGIGSGAIVPIFKAAYGLRNPFGGYLIAWGGPSDRDIVAALRPDSGKLIIKRVRTEEGYGMGAGPEKAEARGQARYFLLGDNKYESIDSREFGPVPMNNIVGRVIVLPRF